MTFAEANLASINARLSLELARLPRLIREWRNEHLPGMRAYWRDRLRKCIAGIRLDLANVAYWSKFTA